MNINVLNTKPRILFCMVVLALVLFEGAVQASSLAIYQPPKFTLKDFQKDFSNMAANKIDIKQPLTWVYSFTGYTQQSLVRAANKLTELGFTPMGMYTDKSVDFYWLDVFSNKVHTPKSLIEQVNHFQQFAKDLNLRSLEKIDVKP